jgi:antitoxin MazE
MKIAIRRMGNSQGVIIPKPVLAQVGLEHEAEMVVEKGAIVLRKPAAKAREGWAEASDRISRAGNDKLVWPEFSNEGDKDIKW